MSEIERVRKSPAPALRETKRKYEVVARNPNGDKLTNSLRFADSNIAYGVITSEQIGDSTTKGEFFMWVGEDSKTPPQPTSYVTDLQKFQQWVAPTVMAAFVTISVGVFFSAWLLAVYPVLLFIYMFFIKPRKPVIEIGMGGKQRVELPTKSDKTEAIFGEGRFRKVLELPNSAEITAHIRRMVNLIGADQIEPEYLSQWLNLLSAILEEKPDQPVELIPYTVDDAKIVLAALVEQNRKVAEREKRELESAESREAAVQEFRMEIVEGQLKEQSETQLLLALDRIKNEDKHLFNDDYS